jgi:hypothetical protein
MDKMEYTKEYKDDMDKNNSLLNINSNFASVF